MSNKHRKKDLPRTSADNPTLTAPEMVPAPPEKLQQKATEFDRLQDILDAGDAQPGDVTPWTT